LQAVLFPCSLKHGPIEAHCALPNFHFTSRFPCSLKHGPIEAVLPRHPSVRSRHISMLIEAWPH